MLPTSFECAFIFWKAKRSQVYNTRLLRSYAQVPELGTLVLAVKRWAKARGLVGTWEHFISSYSHLSGVVATV